MPEFHTDVSVTFKMIDPERPGNPYDDDGTLCAGCAYELDDGRERHYITGGKNTGTIARLWHEQCFLEAAADPTQIWLLMAQQIARRPREFPTGAIRTVLNQLVLIASGAQAADGRIEIQAFTPHLYERDGGASGYLSVPKDGPDGSIVFERCEAPF